MLMRWSIRAAMVAGLIVALAASASAQPAARRVLSLDDFYRIKSLSDPQLSPDGRWVAFVVAEIDREKDSRRSTIWRAEVPAPGGLPADDSRGTPHQLTTRGKTSDAHPRWSPDGKYLAFLADRDEKTQIWLLPTAGGEAWQLTHVKDAVTEFAWAPDSKRLLLVARDPRPDEDESKDSDKEKQKDKTPLPIVLTRLQHKRDGAGYLDRRRNHFYAVGVEGGEAKQVTRGDWDDGDPQWSPDGTRVAFTSNRTSDADSNRNNDIWIVRVDDGTVVKVTTDPGNDFNARWSPDGKWLAYIHTPTNPPVYATPRLMLVPADGSAAPRDLTGALDRHTAGAPAWSRDGRALYVRLDDSGAVPLIKVSLDGGVSRIVADGRDVLDFKIARDDSKLVALLSQPAAPPELFVAPLVPFQPGLPKVQRMPDYRRQNGRAHQERRRAADNSSPAVRTALGAPGAPERLTDLNGPLMVELRLNAPEKIHFLSPDGTPIQGWILKPPQFTPGARHPLILRIHGGPVGQFTGAFSFEHQYLAAQGYVVLYVNPRGSSGYGEAFCRAIFADWGNRDFQDVNAGVDYTIAQGYVDAEKVGVGGWSYGGILTNYCIIKSQRFRAAISGASETDYYSCFGYDDLHLDWVEELGAPWEHEDLYRRMSPITYVTKIRTPTLVMCGEKDFRCPLPQSEKLYLSLKTLGRTTALVIYPGQSHGIRKPSYEVDRLRRYGLWYDKYLRGLNVDPTYEIFKPAPAVKTSEQ